MILYYIILHYIIEAGLDGRRVLFLDLDQVIVGGLAELASYAGPKIIRTCIYIYIYVYTHICIYTTYDIMIVYIYIYICIHTYILM